MDTRELIRKVRKIEIKTRGLSRHLFAGEYLSAFKGRGIAFSEVREYQYGDDVRSIDWNVTARLNQPYVKVFEEERELTVLIMADISQSSLFGTVHDTKRALMTEISAVLAFSAMLNKDKVGAILYSDRVEQYIPPKKGRSHILRIIREFLEAQSEGRGTSTLSALEFMMNVMKKRAIVFLLSDFAEEGYADALRHAARRHDVVGIRMYDQREEQLPSGGLVPVRDLESGQISWVDLGSGRFRRAYEQHYRNRVAYFRESFARSGADTLDVATGSDYVKALLGFFRQRDKRR